MNNYPEGTTDAKLAFGNNNAGTGLGRVKWGKNYLNSANREGGWGTTPTSYEKCTFGLVSGLNRDGTIKYSPGVAAPNLFNEGTKDSEGNLVLTPTTGKTAYVGENSPYKLDFIREGDTYTLSSVINTSAKDLEKFDKEIYRIHSIWTNNFWPMDSADSFGQDRHDMKFGSSAQKAKRQFNSYTEKANNAMPVSDDSQDHNSYFGMHYEVKFEVSADYVGPLEYYFFGDDDMWVFLDGKLVCDIGGVHSAVGEYVNLWDYLEQGKGGEHTLSFFYTERGASGSTCWMRFTLPSVSAVNPVTTTKDYGHLRIEKKVSLLNPDGGVVDNNYDNGEEFKFRIEFTYEDGSNLVDDYSYIKKRRKPKSEEEEEGSKSEEERSEEDEYEEIASDIFPWDGLKAGDGSVVSSGGEFTLKKDEYIVIQYLPKGTKYTIKELGIVDKNSTEDNEIIKNDNLVFDTKIEAEQIPLQGMGVVNGIPGTAVIDGQNNKTVSGTIGSEHITYITYNNKFRAYELPETGGVSTIPHTPYNLYTMAGAAVTLLGAGLLYRKKFRGRRVKNSRKSE